MSHALSPKDIDTSVRKLIFPPDYSPTKTIKNVFFIDLKNNIEEDGDFCEIIRIAHGKIEQVPNFNLSQLNRTKLNPGSVKAWHLHLKQDVLWYLNPVDYLFVGLWDIRKNSPTCGLRMRVVLGEGKAQLLYIPRGVAHGSANFTARPVHLYYFTNRKFSLENPDEKRIAWDTGGADFWTPVRE